MKDQASFSNHIMNLRNSSFMSTGPEQGYFKCSDVQMFIIISVLGAKDLEKGGQNIYLQLIFLLFVQKLCIERLNLWTIWDKNLPCNALFVAVLSFSLLAKKYQPIKVCLYGKNYFGQTICPWVYILQYFALWKKNIQFLAPLLVLYWHKWSENWDRSHPAIRHLALDILNCSMWSQP